MSYPLPKQLLDKTFAFLMLLLFSPVILALFVLMAIDMLLRRQDRGPFFYRERRISGGRPFDLLKLRTLRSDVLDGKHARLLEADPANLTWAGKHVLKPWYLDEVPQLLNVLKGDMSLVGPRPWPPHLVEQQVAEGHTYRNEVPAGLTGLAQVSKGSDQQFQDLDIQYVKRYRKLGGWSLARYDLSVLASTLRVIARGEGLNN
jgi:lipopolysaccharide/colanic/teichoic acid biosynthesis glycosyltransferase